jgi:hypothetical protein
MLGVHWIRNLGDGLPEPRHGGARRHELKPATESSRRSTGSKVAMSDDGPQEMPSRPYADEFKIDSTPGLSDNAETALRSL